MRTQNSRSRFVLGVALALVLLCVSTALSVALGARSLSLNEVYTALTSNAASSAHSVVWDSRIPRTALGLLAGAALGVAGAVMQSMTRNPLADPGILGINAGGAFCVVIAVGFLGLAAPSQYIWFAFAGALAVTLLVYLLAAAGRRGVDPVRLVLAGAALTAVLSGVGEGLALLQPDAFERLQAWAVGSVDVGSLDPVIFVLPFICVGFVLAGLCSRGLDALALGDETASALGFNVMRVRALAVSSVAILAGSVSASAGALAFVGLMVPHAARFFAGVSTWRVLFLSALLGAVVLMLGDVVGRLIVSGEMAAGVVVSFVGAPVLIALALRRRVVEL